MNPQEAQEETCEIGNRRRIDRLAVKLPFGSIELSGSQVALGLMLTLILAPLILGLYMHEEKTDKRLSKIEQHIESAVEAQDVTNYILTLTNEERSGLNLSKPKRLREMERVERANTR